MIWRKFLLGIRCKNIFKPYFLQKLCLLNILFEWICPNPWVLYTAEDGDFGSALWYRFITRASLKMELWRSICNAHMWKIQRWYWEATEMEVGFASDSWFLWLALQTRVIHLSLLLSIPFTVSCLFDFCFHWISSMKR